MNFRLSPQDEQALTAFLQDLVRTPSLSTQEQAVAERLAEEMRRVGFTEVRTDKLGSVVGRLGSPAAPPQRGARQVGPAGGSVNRPEPARRFTLIFMIDL